MSDLSIEERNELVLKNIGLIKKIAGQCNLHNADYEDLIQDGFEKFLTILEKYDSSKAALSTFAWPHITQHIYKNNINMPERLFKLSCRFQKVVEELTAVLNREPTNEEIAHYLGYADVKYDKYRNKINSYNSVSLDKEYDNDDDEASNLYEVDLGLSGATPEEIFFRKEEEALIREAWNELDESEREILSYRTTYNTKQKKPLSLRQIGELTGNCRTTISSKEKQATEHLRRLLEKRGLCA